MGCQWYALLESTNICWLPLARLTTHMRGDTRVFLAPRKKSSEQELFCIFMDVQGPSFVSNSAVNWTWRFLLLSMGYCNMSHGLYCRPPPCIPSSHVPEKRKLHPPNQHKKPCSHEFVLELWRDRACHHCTLSCLVWKGKELI